MTKVAQSAVKRKTNRGGVSVVLKFFGNFFEKIFYETTDTQFKDVYPQSEFSRKFLENSKCFLNFMTFQKISRKDVLEKFQKNFKKISRKISRKFLEKILEKYLEKFL